MYKFLRRLPNANGNGINTALSLAEGHYRFLENNTGTTYDGKVQHYIQNEDGVLSNNRHFIADTQMEYQPNGDGTTEGQSLHIIAHALMYLATKDQKWLDAAVHYWEAYVQYFYEGQPIPETPQRWIANWIINSKEPVLSDWPINPVEPTQGGYKCVPLEFVDGQAQIPHGSPFWGEYLDVVTYAHRAHMSWPAINGGLVPITDTIDWQDVYDNYRVTSMPSAPYDALAWIDWPAYLGKPTYSVDWSGTGTEYPVNWMVAWTGNKIGIGPGPNDELWSGDIIEEGLPEGDKGKIKLQDESINGVYLVNYAVQLPVAHGGYMFARNEPWHNRPIRTPFLGSANQLGNAADGEEWFSDGCYLLWKITGEERYKKALDSCLFTNYEYTLIDSTDKFFRKSTSATQPFTDGISYDFYYPEETVVEYTRTVDGYIHGVIDQSAQVSLEQQTIWFRVNQLSKIRTEYGGVGSTGKPVTAKIRMVIDVDKQTTNEIAYGHTLPKTTTLTPAIYDVDLKHFVRLAKDNGEEYILADPRSVTEYGACTWEENYVTNVYDGRTSSVIDVNFADDSGGFIIGAWLEPDGVAPINSIVYRSTGDTNIRIEDDDGWRWWWMLEDTGGAWVQKTLLPGDLTLSGYQPNHPSDPDPVGPVYDQLDQFTVLLDQPTQTDVDWSYYCVNDIPPRYLLNDGYTLKYRVTLACEEDYEFELGDCTVINYRTDSLAYCPGVIPFSNIYNEGTDQIGAWHGMPYPGYQYPFIYTVEDGYELHLNNMADFLYDSQEAYASHIPELGPVAPAYVWNRWDNYKYGDPDTFTMYHWGDGTAWSGYQPRAFTGAARAWYELVVQGKPVPPKLITFCERWLSWLYQYTQTHNGRTPSNFYPDQIADNDDDINAHMAGLWLAGASYMALAGATTTHLHEFMEIGVKELRQFYLVSDVPNHPMNGAWSSAPRLNTDNGMFFGFHAGEILRGLATYMLYKKLGPLGNMYEVN